VQVIYNQTTEGECLTYMYHTCTIKTSVSLDVYDKLILNLLKVSVVILFLVMSNGLCSVL